MRLYFTFSLLTCSASASAQVVPNRDSAEYYFQRGASFYENRTRPVAWQSAGRRWAMRNYTKSVAFDSSYYWSYRNLGYCHQNFREYELALDNYDRAVLAGSQSSEADAAFVHFNCIEMCQRLEKWGEAEAHCSALLTNPHICAVDSDNSCRGLWLNRAEARIQLKKYAAAKQDYLIYQQQTTSELAAAQQKPAPVVARQKPQRLSKRERAALAADWGEEPKKRPREKKQKKELTPVAKLTQESKAAARKIAWLESMLKQ